MEIKITKIFFKEWLPYQETQSLQSLSQQGRSRWWCFEGSWWEVLVSGLSATHRAGWGTKEATKGYQRPTRGQCLSDTRTEADEPHGARPVLTTRSNQLLAVFRCPNVKEVCANHKEIFWLHNLLLGQVMSQNSKKYLETLFHWDSRRWEVPNSTICLCKAAPGNPSFLLTHKGLGSIQSTGSIQSLLNF